MPTIAGVYIPDSDLPSYNPPASARPSIGAIIGAAAENAYGQVRYGLPYQLKTLQGPVSTEDQAFYQEGLARAAAAGAKAAPASLDDVTSGRVNPVRFAIENLAASVPQTGAIIAGAAGGGLAGGPGGALAGAVAVGTPLFAGSNVARAVEEEGGLSPGAAARGLVTAPVQAAADAVIGRFLPGAGKVIGDVAATQGGGFLRRTATSMLEAAGTEAVTEAAQQMGERYAAGLNVSDSDAAAEYVNAAVTAFAVGGVMGAGGGIRRRSNVEAMTPDQIDTSAIDARVDGFMQGAQQPQLALPAPSQFGRSDFETDVVVDSNGRAMPVSDNNSLTFPDDRVINQVTGLPAPVSDTPVVMSNLPVPTNRMDLQESDLLAPQLADLQQALAAQNPAPDNILTQGGLPAFDPTGIQAPVTDTSIAALSSMPVGATNDLVPAPAVRPLETTELDDLLKARKAKGADPAIIAAVDEEMTFRKQADPFLEVPMNQDIKKLQKLDRDAQLAGVRTLLEDGDARKGTLELAKNLGIDLSAPEAADTVVAQEAPPAPPATTPPVTPEATVAAPTTDVAAASSDAAFDAEWENVKKASGIQRARSGAVGEPTSMPDAKRRVFDLLANDSITRNGQASQVEKMAQTMGLIDENLDVTPAGRETFLDTAAGRQETSSAAQAQGYSGAQESIFDRGVRAAVSGQEDASFSDFADMAAYQAGKVWAQDYVQNGDVRTAAQTQAIMARLEGRTSGTPGARDKVRTTLQPGQVQQQANNKLLEAADLSGVADTDIAMVRQMIRDGATGPEVGAAISQLQGGQTLFKQGPSTSVDLTLPSGRGQPQFKEMNTAAPEMQKAAQRRESRKAQEKYLLQQELRAAHNSGDLTRGEFMRLSLALKNGNTDAVKRGLPGRADARGTTRTADPRLEAAIAGKSLPEVMDHLIETAPTALDAGIMRAVKGAAATLDKIGVKINFAINHAGDGVSASMVQDGTRATTWARHNPARVDVQVNGSDLGEATGMNWETIAHELVHAVTLGTVTDVYRNNKAYKSTQVGRAVQELENLARQVERYVQNRVDGRVPLTAFEQRFLDGTSNAFEDVNEIISWGLTNPDMQQYLDAIPYSPKQTMWQKIVNTLGRIFGTKPQELTALDAILHISEALITAPEAELKMVWAADAAPEAVAALRESVTPDSPKGFEASLQNVAKSVGDAIDNFDAGDLLQSVKGKGKGLMAETRSWRIGAISHAQLDRSSRGLTKPHKDIVDQRTAIMARHEQMSEGIYQKYSELERSNPNHAEWVRDAMGAATEFQLDPEKTWEQHTWHMAKPDSKGNFKAEDIKRQSDMKRLHGELVKMANDMKRGDGTAWKQWQAFRDSGVYNNTMRMAGELHALVAGDRELKLGVSNSWANPMDAFMAADNVDTPAEVRDWWARQLDAQLQAAETFVRDKKGEAATGTPSDQSIMATHLAPIEEKIAEIYEAKKAMNKGPYFHLGRFGDYFGSAVVAVDADGQMDPVAQRKVADALFDAGFKNVQISADNTNPKLAIRFENAQQRHIFDTVVTQLENDGVLQKGKSQSGKRDLQENYGTASSFPGHVRAAIAQIESSPQFAIGDGMSAKDIAALKAHKETAIQALKDAWIESQSDNSISKTLVQRKTISGYDKDMVRSWAQSQRVSAIHIANLATSPKFSDFYENMRAAREDALKVNPTDAAGNAVERADPDVILDLTNELKKRDAQTPINEIADGVDALRAVTHSYFLGFNPAYALINLTQVGVTAIPEMAKKHGYRNAFAAVRRATPQALAILNAARKAASKLPISEWGNVAITSEVLKSAGLDENTRKFVQHMIASSKIDIGSMSRAMGRVADNKGAGGVGQTYLNLSSAFGLYSEMASRLITALAARSLHGGFGPDAQAYARDVVGESMFDYGSGNTARHLGKKGVLGPITSILTQFMSYSTQLLEKLYSETVDAVGSQRAGETPESAKQRRKEAQKFLAGHASVVMVLAGQLGLPMATVFATMVERLVDGLDDDDEPFDATAAYRNFLDSVLGKDVGEVAARGLPHALGFDISGRAGEQNLLPFSEFIADRRSWKDAVANSTGRSIGAAPSMLTSILDGGSKFASGDILGGMKDILPTGLKSPTEAYRMTVDGYVDTKGNKLPMTPKATDVMWQLLGFAPAEKAEYGEVRGDQAARRGEIARRGLQLRQRIVNEMMPGGDPEKARELVAEAIEFDKDNPAFAVVPSLGSSLTRQANARTQAATLRSPIGVSVKDIAGQQMSQYANVDYR